MKVRKISWESKKAGLEDLKAQYKTKQGPTTKSNMQLKKLGFRFNLHDEICSINILEEI